MVTHEHDLPGYVGLNESGELDDRAALALELLEPCRVCPRECQVNRLHGVTGFCKTGLLPVIASSGPHFGEEAPLVGRNGSGTIFATHCNLSCDFCQNYEISQCGIGQEMPCDALADRMLQLQRRGCHNINLVTPSHIVPQILRSLVIAVLGGLTIPLVYNSSGYDAVQTLQLLDGVVDIYMPDAKYGTDEVASALSHAPHYVETMQAAIREMHRQVGELVVRDGVAVRGLNIRHLVLPDNLARSDLVLPWIAREISEDAYVNIMAQYNWPRSILPPAIIEEKPEYRALLRPITGRKYADAVGWARSAGLHRGFPS
jgi:putative pyruvate formate lyase activating enzyme